MLTLPKPPADLDAPVASLEVTPKRRGHRHKRSFAVSGDFEFLKKDSILKNPIPNFEQDQRVDNGMLTPAAVPREHFDTGVPLSSSTYNDPSNQPYTSPKFFMSEEPTFTGNFKNVPDAIINLDDVLKTKPRSFKSHRRTESAPADLQLAFSLEKKLRIKEELVTEEEEEGEEANSDRCPLANNSSSISSENRGIDKKNSGANTEIPKEKTPETRVNEEEPEKSEHVIAPITLMSPLKARCPSPVTAKESPSKVGYNTLKINKQKERYYNFYSKQIPSNGSGQSSIGHYASNISLSSESCSSYKGVSTPNTPVSTSQGRKTSSRAKPFKFESQVYDIKIEETNIESPSVLVNNANEHTIAKPSNITPSDFEQQTVLSRDILLGEPGDVADPSKCKETSATSSKHVQNRSISDPIVFENKTNHKSRNKKKHSRLGIISTLFSKPKR